MEFFDSISQELKEIKISRWDILRLGMLKTTNLIAKKKERKKKCQQH